MPFGKKVVNKKKWLRIFPHERKVNFDHIYTNIFAPAIGAVVLPEGGKLISRRADSDFFSGDISQEMFQYLEYSRFVLGDITGLNANVFYELGIRHGAHQAGTAIFRQLDSPIPFDVNHIRVFPYEYEPEQNIIKSQQLITQVLTKSLRQNRLDSPVQIALRAQRQQSGNVDRLLKDAENAIRNYDLPKAIAKYRAAIPIDRENPTLHLELGLLLKAHGEWQTALIEFEAAVTYSPDYADAYREKGIAENKLFRDQGQAHHMPTGEDSLRQAIALNPEDFDAHASLGGILKRQGRFKDALAMYECATTLSYGNTYPLLNEVKIRARLEGKMTLDDRHKLLLERAQRSRQAQTTNDPPYDAPWSFFDLSEIHLYFGDREAFLGLLDDGIRTCSDHWYAQTHRDSLQLLVDGGVNLPGLNEGIRRLDTAIHNLSVVK